MTHPANQHLRTSQVGIDLIKSFESWYSRAYRDPVGVWTIGWGTTNQGPNGRVVWPGRTITKEQGENYLRDDLREVEEQVKRVVKVPLTQQQFDALVSLTYNMGIGNLKKSPVLKMLNRKNYDAVPGLMLKHNTARDRRTGRRKVFRGLTRRREAEGALFMAGAAVVEPASFEPIYHTDGGFAGPESAIEATDTEPQSGALMDTLKSDTMKTQIMTWSGIVTTLMAAIEPITRNPVLLIGLVIAGIGVGAALYIKYRDTKQGR